MPVLLRLARNSTVHTAHCLLLLTFCRRDPETNGGNHPILGCHVCISLSPRCGPASQHCGFGACLAFPVPL